MTRSLVIVLATLFVVAASYVGFSRLADRPVTDSRSGTIALPKVDASATAPAPANDPRTPPDGTTSPGLVAANAPAAASAISPDATAAANPAPGTFAIRISRAVPPGPGDVIRVHKDERVTLTIASDRRGKLEVHGYRKEIDVTSDRPAELSFTATRTGRFPIDLHAENGDHVEVTALEVLPRDR